MLVLSRSKVRLTAVVKDLPIEHTDEYSIETQRSERDRADLGHSEFACLVSPSALDAAVQGIVSDQESCVHVFAVAACSLRRRGFDFATFLDETRCWSGTVTFSQSKLD